jgi:hypothetical protein
LGIKKSASLGITGINNHESHGKEAKAMVAQIPTKRNCERPISPELQMPEVHAQLDSLTQWICQSARAV